MSCRNVITQKHNYRFCPEDPINIADRLRAVMQGRFIDELTGRALRTDLAVSTDTQGLTPRAAFNGVAGLVGNPARLFPGLALGSVQLDMRVDAHRFIARDFSATLGPIVNYPSAFSPVDLGDVFMHRSATVLYGRTVRASAVPRPPLAAVNISIAGIWPQFPAADVDPLTVVEAPNIAALQPGLYAPRLSASDVLRRRDLVLSAGDEKTLMLPVESGETELRISDRVNLNPGDILAIEPGHADLVEYILIDSISPSSTPDQPARLSLLHRLAHRHLEGATLVRAVPQAPGANNNLIRDGIANDRTVFLNALTDLASASTVEISGSGSGTAEYQTVALYQAQSDAEGYYRLPPLHRVAQFQLHAARADLPQPVDLRVSPDYDLVECNQDLVFE